MTLWPADRLKSSEPSVQKDISGDGAPDAPRRGIAGAAAGLIVFALPFSLYLKTLCPSIYPGDGPELAAAAWVLGVPHPTGYPLFMALGHLFQRVGLGSPAYAMNLFCALSGALACLAAYLFQRTLWRLVIGREKADRAAFRFAAAGTALFLGAGATWWDQSTQTEVYALFLIFLSGGWILGLRLIENPTPPRLRALALWSGIAFLHHLLFLATLPLSLIGAWVFRRKHAVPASPGSAAEQRPFPPSAPESPRRTSSRAAFGIAALLFLLPLLGYLYLPIRAAASPAINAGDPRSLGGLLQHVTGGQYRPTRILMLQTPQGFRKITAAEFPGYAGGRMLEILRWMDMQVKPLHPDRPVGDQFFRASPEAAVRPPVLGLIFCLLAVFGLVSLYRSFPPAAWGLGLGLLLNLAVVLVYTIPDIHVYQLPLWFLVCALAAVGAATGADVFLSDEQEEKKRRDALQRRRGWIVGGAACALAVYSAWNWFPPERGVNKAETTNALEYARGVLEALPPNSALFTHGDYDIYPLWYAQVCENLRPDVAVIGANFALSGWYAAMLRVNLPQGLEISLGDEPPSTSDRWLIAFLGGMAAPILQAGRPVFMTEPSVADFEMITRYFDLHPRFRFPSPLPGAPDFPILVYEMEDTRGVSGALRRRFFDMFGPAKSRRVTGKRILDNAP